VAKVKVKTISTFVGLPLSVRKDSIRMAEHFRNECRAVWRGSIVLGRI